MVALASVLLPVALELHGPARLPLMAVDLSRPEIWNCIRPGGWSEWSKWSKCREGVRKRRRNCNNPLPIATICYGSKIEKQKCAVSSNIPEYLFGEWTSWNPWSRCDCNSNQRLRSRHCKGNSCEGCDKQYEDCLPGSCPVSKKWSSWTDWVDYGIEQVRYSAWCSSSNVANVDVGFRTEVQESNKHAEWSEWNMHPGVTYRYRILRNSSISIEHHLLSRSTSSCLPLYFAIPIFCFSILTGFILQNIILCVVNRCQRKFSKLTYSYDSDPRDYPSHLIRSPKDESFW
ncbi:hypothetical protein GCK72_010650 [Caenorhabditis remanei]|uniref:Uncharacterized protein n=1 Tax=Caenorhabditis remanei TaxID=31234 RepID=A0A6A5H3V4_CAERE|nr:hypothetical protein GCK72_010650 [Caenorhabditis remanei]KAF1762388.1 hypothetical protein GCK72_010650 [Caenorhabditis remanei]